jgi:predicted nucleic acid-binding protein
VIVVSDTSPLLNLQAVGQLHLLTSLYSEVLIPPAVAAELMRNQVSIPATSIRIVTPHDTATVARIRQELDPGESEAIVLAIEHAALLLIDEKAGRRKAATLGLTATGLLGVLAEAKTRGLIPACAPILEDMIQRAGFWISDDLRLRYLKTLGE